MKCVLVDGVRVEEEKVMMVSKQEEGWIPWV